MKTHRKSLRKQPVQSRSQVTFDAILEATIQVLLRDGAGKLTTTLVAERAGVSVGTLYQYFSNKQALIAAVKAKYFGLMATVFVERLSDSHHRDPKESLAEALKGLLEVKQANVSLSIALAEIPNDPDEPDFKAEVVEHFACLVEPMLIRLGPDGPETSRQRAIILVAAIEGILSFAIRGHREWLSQKWFVQLLHERVLKPIASPDGP